MMSNRDVFIDGSCTENGVGGIGIFWGPNNPNNLKERVREKTTASKAEILAAVRVVQQSRNLRYENVRVFTDSENVCTAVNENMVEWKRNGWRSLWDGQKLKDTVEFQQLANALQNNARIHFEFNHVPGHSGHGHNQEANRLAREATRL